MNLHKANLAVLDHRFVWICIFKHYLVVTNVVYYITLLTYNINYLLSKDICIFDRSDGRVFTALFSI